MPSWLTCRFFVAQPFDGEVAWELTKSLALTPGPVLLLLIFAYSIGVQAFSEDGEGSSASAAWLEERAERSRNRRKERLRDLATRIQPLEGWFGWELVDKKSGNPTVDAYVFLAIAAALQVAFVLTLTAPLRSMIP